MASNNIILAVPSANSSVNYELPDSESAQLSFTPEDIDGIKLDANGGLVISFVEGGNVTLSNFQSFIDNGNTLSLADGTKVDPKLLFNALGGQNDNPFPTADVTKIGIPTKDAQNDITLEPGKKYLFNFDLSETQGANVKDGKMVIDFENGGKIVIANYETAMADKNPPELSLASKTCIVSGDDLITNIQELAKANPIDPTVLTEEEQEALKRKSKVADADMEGKEDTGVLGETDLGYKAAKIQPAAGDPDSVAEQLAKIETAAGGAAGAGRAGGYGYGSRFAPDPFLTNPDIGPINPTQLGYRAPILEPSQFIIRDADGNPIMIQPDAKFIDETDLENGAIVVNGQLNIDYGADGPGGVGPNGTFTSGGSQTGGVLSHNGVPVEVSVVGNTYIGVAGNVKVFELTIDPVTGAYKFTQFENIDHADGSNPNDQIALNFGVTARDGDGDPVSTTIQIVIADDVPEIEGSSGKVDETDFGATISTSGNLAHDYGQDGPGKIETTGQFSSAGSQKNGKLTSAGVDVDVTSTPTGYVGKAGNVVVFTLTINPANGNYTYTQFKNLDHADGSNPNDEIKLTFGAKIVDYDGDSDSAPIVITVVDDGPDFQTCGCGPKPDKGLEIVDETNLKSGPVVETGKLDADFGADVPGSYGFKPDSFTSSGSKANNALTHNGVPVVVSLVNGEWIGKAGDLVIFKLEMNVSTGDYKFTLYDNFDHADKTNPDDQITLDFGVIASDNDGDGTEGSIRIIVKDDGPNANNDVNTYDTTFGVANGNVISGENGGPGAADVLSTDGKTNGSNENTVVKIAFGGNEVEVPAVGTVSIDGQYGKLTIAADGTYTYKAFDNGGMVNHGAQKEFVSGPALPDFDESEALDNVEKQSLGVAPGNLSVNGGETVTVKFHSEQAGYGNTMGVFTVGPDGKLRAETVLIKDGNAASSGQSFNYTAASGATSLGFFIVADGAKINHGYPGIDFSKGSLDFVYNYGQPGAREAKISDDGSHVKLVYTSEGGVKTVIDGPLYFTSDRGSMDNLNADGTVRVVSGVPNGDEHTLRIGFEDLPCLGDKDYNDMVFDVSIKGADCGCQDPDIKDEFVYTLKDGDGDTDKATLTLNGKDLTNDKPIIAAPAAEIVDETNLKDGVITETGTVTANFGSDGPGTIEVNNSFNSSGSKLNGALTSGGVAVNVTLDGNTYVGKAGNVTVFTLAIQSNGSYTFKLYEQLDHADGTNPNDEIALNFGVKAIDCDGDKADTTITVKVKDDAPDAKDDGKTAVESGTVTGNVTSNDIVGQDTPGTVTKVTFGNQSYDVPANGSIQIIGQFGKLTIDKTGAYSYTANSNNPNGTDSFIYTLKDNDGDKDTACLSINVTSTNDCPVVVKPAIEIVDETNLKDGVITETGTVNANYFGDGPGAITANNSFASSGSKLNGNLTSGGVAVQVTLNGNTYEGKAGGVTVFTMQVGTNGAYTFKLFEQLDHADGNNPNDVITLDFGVTATDADGDKDSTTITVNVKDDAPDAKDDGKQASEGGTVTGNVTDNDIVGQDVPGTVTKVQFGNQSYNVPANGTIQIVGQYGKLTIDKTGAYSYTANSNNPNGTDSFTYTLKDNDGDTDTACLSISVTCNNDVPTITSAVETVDETGLVITETGNVTANYGADGPGTITPNGAFVAGGSKLNGALTSNGVTVSVALNGNTYEGKANGVTVFTLQVSTNGAYTYKQYEQLDHADGSNPNDIISLQFGVKATDSDGDSSASTITINVKDDAPDAKDDGKQASEGGTVTGNVTDNDVVGQDTPGTVTKVKFGNQSYDIPANGSIQIVGQFGKLTIDKTGAYSYTANSNNPNGTDSFTYTLRDYDGDTDTACLAISVTCNNDVPTITSAVETVDETGLVITETGNVTASYGADGPGSIAPNNSFTSGGSKLNGNLTSGGVAVQVTLNGNTYEGKANGVTVFTLQVGTNGAYTYKQYEQLDHADGANPNDIISLQFGVKATDADGDSSSSTITINVKDDAPDAKDDGKQASEGGTVMGNVTDNDVVGQDTPGTVTKVKFGNQTYDVPANGSIQIVGQYGKLTIDKTGAYSYTANSNNPNGTDSFTYTLRDYDGDTDTACLSIDVTCNNDVPTITAAIETIDETNLASGIITETGNVTASYGADGPGSIAPNNSFTSGGSKLNGNLTSGGVAVNVTLNGNTYEGKANGVTVFTLQVGTNGAYTFKLFEQLDHADGNNPNDIISLQFGVKATDADGDSTNSTITVNVKDDAPDAKDDGKQASEGGTVTGNVTDNDIVGQDVPGTVTKVQFGNQSYNVPANGTVQIVGQYGKLTIDKTGAYSYTANSNNPNGTDSFTYTLKDNDGDTDTACLSISVTCNNDVPTITSAVETVDETGLVITETGNVTASYGADGPGSIAPNNSFASSGSKLNGNLTSNGVAVQVTLNGNTYEGKAGGVTVFTLQVGTNGAYTYKQYEQLDHADGNNPNDIISLQFGVKATDADGDSSNATITVNVKDDAPDAKDDGKQASEGGTVTGNVTDNDVVGQDTPGTVTKVQFGNQSYNVPANGTVQVVGQYGTLTIDKTGAYSYTAHNNNPNGTDSFTYTLRDYDGDTDTACLAISVTCNNDVPTITAAVETIDETNLASGIITETGSVTATYGADGPGSIAPNNSFTSGGSKLNGNLTSGGVAVQVTLNGNTYEGKAGGVTVFTLAVQSNGAYTFKLFEQLDHADGSNPNDIISLQFGVKATDADGDSTNSTITVNVKDDAPDAKDDGKQASEGGTVTGNVTDNDIVGQDVPGTVTKVQFGNQSYNVPANGTVQIVGNYGTLTIDKTGAYSYTAHNNNPNGVDSFTYTLKDNDGDTDTACLSISVTCNNDVPTITAAVETIDETNLASGIITETGSVTATYGADGPGSIAPNNSFASSGSKLNGNLTSGGVAVNVTLNGNTYEGKAGGVTVFTLQVGSNGAYTFKLFEQLDHADGSNPNDIISLQFGVKATDADGDSTPSTITVNVKDDAPDAKDDGKTATEGQTVTGNVTSNDIVGQDVPGTVTKVQFGNQSYNVPANGTVQVVGQYGTLTIDKTGAYSYTAHNNNPNGVDAFTYTLKDNDGDTDTACLSFTVTCQDDQPTITCAVETIDETNLVSGIITEGGNVVATYGNDGPGAVTANGSFTSGGSKLNGALTSGGVPVTVGLNGNTYEGKANGVLIFTLAVQSNGAYSFKLYEQLDHADGNNPNDIIELNFGVKATDADGDIATGTVTINVKDDAPDAKDDGKTATNTTVVTGNVTDNDIVGQDVPGAVTKIQFNGVTKDVPASGTVSIAGAYGTLVIDKTGAYTYTVNANANGTDNFTYTLKDNDGDKDTACLSIVVKNDAPPPVVCINVEDACVKEDGNINVPVTASFTGGSGNETMTISLSGVPSGWVVTGWTNNGGGNYSITLPQGQKTYDGQLNFKPPANSDVDLTGLSFKASVYDPDTNASTIATDKADIIVDAVIDPLSFTASAQFTGQYHFTNTWENWTKVSKININNITHPDADGSESLKSIKFTLDGALGDDVIIAMKNNDGTYSQAGVKGTTGSNGDTTYTIDLSGMTYDEAKNFIQTKLYLYLWNQTAQNGSYDLGITIVSYEKNLSGIEKDYTDNQTSYTVTLPILFCLSPLVIDMDGDGVELLSQQNGVMFDMDNDGVKDKSGWAAKDDALLVLDKNKDGLINDRSELFGNDEQHSDGFANLASYDLNNDGVIDMNDDIFQTLQVWQDVNSDGISQADEMRSLADVGIKSINLNADEVNYDIAGNPITHESTVTFEDGSSSQVVDAWFAYQGGAGVDKGLTLRGTDGSDVMAGGSGNDDLYGGTGADTFLFQTIAEGVDTIKDFNAAEGDKIDLSNVLTNYDPVTHAITDFVFATETDDGKTILSVNADGTGGAAAAHQFAVIESTNVSVTDLFNNGSIIV